MPYRRKTTEQGRHTPEIWPVFAAAARRPAPIEKPVVAEPMESRTDERPRNPGPFHGRWWTRTTDLFLIREAL